MDRILELNSILAFEVFALQSIKKPFVAVFPFIVILSGCSWKQRQSPDCSYLQKLINIPGVYILTDEMKFNGRKIETLRTEI